MQLDDAKWGKGFRALVIRNYHALINNVEYKRPCISLIGLQKETSAKANLQLVVSPPDGVEFFRSGDNISLEVELITLPQKASDYYGSNEEFRCHIQQYPDSWRTIHREANGNDLHVEVFGGILKSSYPLRILVTNESKVRVKIIGGVGAIPMRFEGLPSNNYILNQMKKDSEDRFAPEVHGNDYWQTDYNTKTSFSLTFNISIGEYMTETTWVLQKSSG